MKKRMPWLDIAKFIGMFFIYIGHFTTAAGRFYPFVVTFHVPMFFFLSGCSEWLSKQDPFPKFLWKNTKTLLIPLFLFSFASVAINFIYCSLSGKTFDLLSSLHHICNGNIRVHFYAASLWFLSCLFVMRLVFYFLRKYLRFRLLIFAACLALFVIANTALPISPVVSPTWPYNVDSMLYYIVFYALGYCLMAPAKWLLEQKESRWLRWGLLATTSVYAGFLFFGKNLLAFLYVPGPLSMPYDLLIPMVLTLWVILLSNLLRYIPLIARIGQSSLYLCGSEYIIKVLVAGTISVLGLTEPVTTPLYTALYTLGLLVLCWLTLVPIEKFIFQKLKIA